MKFFNNLLFLSLLILCLFWSADLNGQKLLITDGPYIDRTEGGFTISTIIDNIAISAEQELLRKQNFDVLPFDITVRDTIELDTSVHYININKIAAISDIHGQYDVMIKLFQSNGIIDSTLNWTFGEGHLVITGDVFDRGDQVTEILWFIYELEHQARLDGGRVHFLLGNHEVMVLGQDLRYIHQKYRYTSAILGRQYDQLFDSNSILGEWLRSKPICISINDIVFLHAGFSKKIIEEGYTIDSINFLFSERMIGLPAEQIINDTSLNTLYLDLGPVWYRGYLDSKEFSEQDAIDILQSLGKNHIVVGHSSMKSILSLYNNRIFMIDSSIKFGKTGEVLFWENGGFHRGSILGDKLEISTLKILNDE